MICAIVGKSGDMLMFCQANPGKNRSIAADVLLGRVQHSALSLGRIECTVSGEVVEPHLADLAGEDAPVADEPAGSSPLGAVLHREEVPPRPRLRPRWRAPSERA